MKRLKNVFLFPVVLMVLAGCGGVKIEEPITETRLMLDTYCTITLYGTKDMMILVDAFALCEYFESIFSITIEGSDVWRINHANGMSVDVSEHTRKVIEAGLEYCALSEGMFDISIGSLTELWDFSGQSGIPSLTDIEAARDSVGYSGVSIDGNTVWLENPDTRIDPGAIAKGYIADVIADFLKTQGISGAVIDLGGNIVIVGEKPDGGAWRVGISKPFSQRSELIGYIESEEASVVSAGIYERQFEFDGEIYHHILDPFTGFPVVSDVISATVVTERSIDGDALSTILVLVGSEQALGIVNRVSGFIGAVLILDNGDILEYGETTVIIRN